VIALISAEHSASIDWGDEDSDAEPVDSNAGDNDRLTVSRSGFQVIISFVKRNSADLSKVNSRHISRYVVPADCALDPSIFVPGLFHGETAQGFWTVTYVPQATRSCTYYQRTFTTLSLKQLL
jgi:hypothetical protein